MMAKVEIYTSDTCHFCHAAKEYFKENNIEYTEHNISKDMEARKTLMKKGYMSVPLIIIDGEEILGFDKDRIKNLLNL
ncbi:glutaredoxin-like YruB-family protein [Fonticella tunisiensis]|uniref:Glutaredoxin-like YruB-family protein n=2 Tax=Fonticella tunisiensis TaxID=1096341 RepID=A0A4R7K5A8_9CLOT|nr:glutaredoxin family protein [Fonticella tunisiensis]TDT46041.1 glutaredoxin-like YruB-family protein [Fonticella tunisiensis]